MVANLLSQNWVFLLIAGVLLVQFVNGLVTGRAILIFTEYKKSEDPLAYWMAIGLSAVVGTGCFIVLIIKLF